MVAEDLYQSVSPLLTGSYWLLTLQFLPVHLLSSGKFWELFGCLSSVLWKCTGIFILVPDGRTGLQVGNSGGYFWLVINRAKATSGELVICSLHHLDCSGHHSAPWAPSEQHCAAQFPFPLTPATGWILFLTVKLPWNSLVKLPWNSLEQLVRKRSVLVFPPRYSLQCLSPLLFSHGSPSLHLMQLPCVFILLPIKIRF